MRKILISLLLAISYLSPLQAREIYFTFYPEEVKPQEYIRFMVSGLPSISKATIVLSSKINIKLEKYAPGLFYGRYYIQPKLKDLQKAKLFLRYDDEKMPLTVFLLSFTINKSAITNPDTLNSLLQIETEMQKLKTDKNKANIQSENLAQKLNNFIFNSPNKYGFKIEFYPFIKSETSSSPETSIKIIEVSIKNLEQSLENQIKMLDEIKNNLKTAVKSITFAPSKSLQVSFVNPDIIPFPTPDISKLLTTDLAAIKDIAVATEKEKASNDLARKLFQEGTQYISSKEFTSASDRFSKVLELIPNQPETILNRAIANFEANSLEKAIADFDLYINLKNNQVPSSIIFYRGLSYYKINSLDKAFADFDRLITETTESYPYFYRGLVLLNKSDYQLAIKDFSAVLSKDKNNNYALYQRGLCYYYSSDYKNALHDLELAKTNNLEDPKIYYFSGLCNEAENNKAVAEDNYNKAIELKSDWGLAYLTRGNMYYNSLDFPKAIADYTATIEKYSTDKQDLKSIAYANRANIYLIQNNLANSLNDYTEALKLNPTNSYIYANRGKVFYLQNNSTSAIADLNKALEIDNTNKIAFLYRGLTNYGSGNIDSAFLDFSEAIKLDHNFSEAYLNRGLIYELKNEPEKAIQDYEKALTINPQSSAAIHLSRLKSS